MLHAGFATRAITPQPPESVFLGGYAARTHNAEGVHDDLFVHAMCLSDGITRAVLVTVDCVGVMAEQFMLIRARITSRLGIENVIVAATHDHSAPDTRMRMRRINGAWCDRMVEEAISTAADAVNALSPVTAYAGFLRAPEVARNRRGEPAVDDELFAMRFVDESGLTCGVFVNYACHCTVLDANNYLITADYPAFLYQELAAAFDGADVLFTNAACGNINIGYSADASALGADMGDVRSFANAERMAETLVRGVKEIFAHAEALPPTLIFRAFPLELPLKPDLPTRRCFETRIAQIEKEEAGASAEEKQTLSIKRIYDECILNNLVEYHIEGKNCITAETALLRIGDVLFLTVPLELFCEIGMRIKQACLPDCRVVILGYSNGYYGYLPTQKAHEAGGYECETSVHRKDSEMNLVEQILSAKEALS